MDKPFKFKEFTVKQDKCAMKIGTDGVLLGAWTSLANDPNSILDIGSGTGVIALQLAQRSSAALIDAVEIDEAAYEQCIENFEGSPWADRLFCYHASIQEFASEIDESYDLIVSNPPFFDNSFAKDGSPRERARFEEALPFEHLFVCVAHLLSGNGAFALIVPRRVEDNIIQLAALQGLYPFRICRVKGTPNSEEKRSLLQFSFDKNLMQESTNIIIETERHRYTEEYIDLVKDFYLKM